MNYFIRNNLVKNCVFTKSTGDTGEFKKQETCLNANH